jgi:hypothetical protein
VIGREEATIEGGSLEERIIEWVELLELTRTRIEQKGMFDFVNENCERVITL